MDVPKKRLNYSTFQTEVKNRTIGKLHKHISLLNCEVDCIGYGHDSTRYIPTDVIGGPTLSKMLHERLDPPSMIIDSMQTGDFCDGHHYPSTSAGFGRILKNIGNPVEIKKLIDNLREIVENDPYMEREDKAFLLGIHKHEKFLYECFLYTLRHKGNASKRLKKKDARRIQDQTIRSMPNVSSASQALYDIEDEYYNDN